PSPGQVSGLVKIAGIFTHGEHTLVTSTRSAVVTYTYDRLYRLTNDGATAYTYDPTGNRLTTNKGGSTTTYTYDRADRLTNVGGVAYTVNAAGNQTGRGPDTFAFDQANRLTTSSVSGTTTTYAYNGDGLRKSKTTGATTTSYVFDVNGNLSGLIDDGARKYVWGLGLAYGVDGNGAITAAHTDVQRSVRALTDAAGALTQTYERDAFGVEGAVDGTSA